MSKTTNIDKILDTLLDVDTDKLQQETSGLMNTVNENFYQHREELSRLELKLMDAINSELQNLVGEHTELARSAALYSYIKKIGQIYNNLNRSILDIQTLDGSMILIGDWDADTMSQENIDQFCSDMTAFLNDAEDVYDDLFQITKPLMSIAQKQDDLKRSGEYASKFGDSIWNLIQDIDELNQHAHAEIAHARKLERILEAIAD